MKKRRERQRGEKQEADGEEESMIKKEIKWGLMVRVREKMRLKRNCKEMDWEEFFEVFSSQGVNFKFLLERMDKKTKGVCECVWQRCKEEKEE